MDTVPHFLVTAGNTREKIDLVRDWGNIFTGKTGFDIALALLDLGNVTLLTSSPALAYQNHRGAKGVLTIKTFRDHAELQSLLEQHVTTESYQAIFMTAAVSDYKPVGGYKVVAVEKIPGSNQERWVVENVQAGKIKSTHEQVAILGSATPKLVDMFRSVWKYQGLLFKFKLEVGLTPAELIEVASASRRASGADYIIANTLDMVPGQRAGGEMKAGEGGGEKKPGAFIIAESFIEPVERTELAMRLRDLTAARLSL